MINHIEIETISKVSKYLLVLIINMLFENIMNQTSNRIRINLKSSN